MPGIGEFVLLHVIRKVEGDQAAWERTVREVETGLERARSPLERAGVPVRTLIRFGRPCREICDAATDEQVGMIMMSRYGKMDYLRQVPLGATTSEVTLHTRVPVLVACTEIRLTVSVRELGGSEVLYMYAVVPLVNFYASLGFVSIKEKELPASIRQRYAWALGNLKGTNVYPMKRMSG
ncbi:MAG: universal stress protein [Methanofollis sp.]|uniref:universal stress protein n=1 Tax=Methanofollis sp. TaxID=2052835 RepID=UPI0026253580|nr:universal stress protein [Methanofollis sp.]MDD4254890.1 universal stress protein [Methanofollis sp.]